MTDELRPPPLPRPFEDTEPGLGLLAAKQENAQLRMERDKARRERDAARVAGSTPPPRRHGKTVAIELGKFAVAAPVLIVAGKMAAKRWPEFGELIDAALAAVGLQ